MSLLLATRHSEDFDIHTGFVDPARSPYVATFGDKYFQKVREFYNRLGVNSAIWAVPISQAFEFFEFDKPLEYRLEVQEDRVIAYVEEWTWSEYLQGRRTDFQYSLVPIAYERASVLVAPPLTQEEIKEVRRYRASASGRCELVETRQYRDRPPRAAPVVGV